MKELLFRISRLKKLGLLVGIAFTYVPFLVPVKKVAYSKKVCAFYHPSPSLPDHILIVPRKVAGTIFELTAGSYCAVVGMAQRIYADVAEDFALLINGGARQDVMQAHFHLFTGDYARQKGLDKKTAKPMPISTMFYWNQFKNSLPAFLQDNGITTDAFSVLIQFQNDAVPMVYVL